tara:strand:- start:786 stop:3032 length:2247 start_codon:yes stop_codon:yes gene_type:complete
MIDKNIPIALIWISGSLSALYIITLLINLLFKCTRNKNKGIPCQCCCIGTDHFMRPWSPLLFTIRDFLYDRIIRNPICFLTMVLLFWGISIINIDTDYFKDGYNNEIKSYVFENNTLTPEFKNVTKYTGKDYYSVDLDGFENLLNVLLPLFFAVALQKYMSTRNAFLGFCGEVEFMAIYFMTLTNNDKGITGKLESQLERIKKILCMMPTTVYEYEKDKDFGPDDLYYDHSNSYEGNWNSLFNFQKIKIVKLADKEYYDYSKYKKQQKKQPKVYNKQGNRINQDNDAENWIQEGGPYDKYMMKIPTYEQTINKSILRDIKRLHETGLGLFECLLHLLIGYIDKIKQEKSSYNTSIERDFIVKWNHINAGWGDIDNSVSYKTPNLLDVMFRISLCVYAFFKPRTLLFTCEADVCENIVWASFGAIFPYVILFVFSDILQDPFQDYKLNPTVTKTAFNTQHNVKKLINLQLSKKHHFSYDDGYDGLTLNHGCGDKDGCYNPSRKKKMSLLKNCVPLDADQIVELFELNETLFNRCSLYKNNDTFNWKELYEIMTDHNCWKIEDNPIKFKVSPGNQPTIKTINTPEHLGFYLKNKLGWRQYDQIMFSIYASNEVRIHIQQIIFSGLDYEDLVKKMNEYIKAIKGIFDNKPTCSERLNLQNLDKNILQGCNNEIYPKNEKEKTKKENEQITEQRISQNKKYFKGLEKIWNDIKENIDGDVYEYAGPGREASKASLYIDIFKNKNRDGHLKFV